MKRMPVAMAALLVWAGIATATDYKQCSSPGASNVVISVSTRRNTTGHWNIAVGVNNEAQRLLSNHHDHGVALTVGQTTSFCNLTGSVRLFAAAAVSTRMPPPSNYELMFGMGYYRIYPSALAWHDAQRSCETEGAHLLVINSDLEANVVREFLARKPAYKNQTSTGYVFLGFHDRYKEGEFVTVLGSPLEKTGYLQWLSGHPSGGASYNCGCADQMGKLFVHPCTHQYAYICEFNELM